MPPRILIACLGNIFMGDDGFGFEVARRLAECPLPDGVRVVDFGIRSLDLTFALLDDDEIAILVDAVPRGEPPGTLYLIEAESDDPDKLDPASLFVDAHDLDPARVLNVVASERGRTKAHGLWGASPLLSSWSWSKISH